MADVVGGQTMLTLLDWAKLQAPDGQVETVVEILSEQNDILKDMIWQEGNLPTGHRTSLRTALPSASWRVLNKGVSKSSSKSEQYDFGCGMIETYSKIDVDLADLNGNTAAFRAQEDAAFMEAMNQTFADALFYGDIADNPSGIIGFDPWFDSTTSRTGNQIIKGSGSGNTNTSIFIATWGPDSIFGVFPKGSTAGIKHTDKGIMTVQDDDGNDFEAYVAHYQWKVGLVVRDYRYFARICNIDVSALATFGSESDSSDDIITLIIKALHKIKNGRGRKVIYCNETILTYLDLMAQSKTNVSLSLKEFAGQEVLTFRGIPIRQCDAIVETEATIS